MNGSNIGMNVGMGGAVGPSSQYRYECRNGGSGGTVVPSWLADWVTDEWKWITANEFGWTGESWWEEE